MSSIRVKASNGLKVGDTFTIQRQYTEADMQRFGDVTRDYNPVHFDDRFAAAKDFKSRICHGLLVASLLTEIGGQIGWLASGMNFHFKSPVYFQDTICCELTVLEIDGRRRAKAEAIFRNQSGHTVIRAELTGIVPGPTEQAILKKLLAEGAPAKTPDRNA